MDSTLLKASVAGAAALALLVGGGTLAALSDLAIVPGNDIQVGTLELTMDGAGGTTPTLPFDVTMVPGGPVEAWAKVLTVSGDVPASSLYASVTAFEGVEDGCNGNTDPAIDDAGREIDLDPACTTPGPGGQLAEAALMRVSAYRLAATERCNADIAGSARYDRSNPGAAYAIGAPSVGGVKRLWNYAPLDEVNDGAITEFREWNETTATWAPLTLAPGDRVCVAAAVQVPASVGNEVQGDSASFDVRFDLVQR